MQVQQTREDGWSYGFVPGSLLKSSGKTMIDHRRDSSKNVRRRRWRRRKGRSHFSLRKGAVARARVCLARSTASTRAGFREFSPAFRTFKNYMDCKRPWEARRATDALAAADVVQSVKGRQNTDTKIIDITGTGIRSSCGRVCPQNGIPRIF